MSFINWGHESPEQKAARRKFEEDEMMFIFEQRAATAAATAAAAASGNAGVYCGGDKLRASVNLVGLDFFDSIEFAPTDADLLAYWPPQDDFETEYRAARDIVYKAQNEKILNELNGVSDSSEVPEFGENTIYNRGPAREAKISIWCNNLTEYEEWTIPDSGTGLSAAQVLPGVINATVLPAVELESQLPTVGRPGEIIMVLDGNVWFAWSPAEGAFSSSFYDTYLEPTLMVRRARRDASWKAKTEMSLAMAPFLWASYYLPNYRIVKDNIV